MKKIFLLVLLLAASTPIFAQQVINGNSVYVGGAGVQVQCPNDTTTGTTKNLLAKATITGCIKATTTDTNIPVWIVTSSTATNGSASLASSGQALCVMDTTVSSNSEGYYVIASTTVAGECHPQSAQPTGVFIIGMLISNSTLSGSTAIVQVVSSFNSAGGGGGSVTGVTASSPLASSGGTAPNISLTGIVPVANGGTGTSTPAIVAGTNVTVSGSWPNQTINTPNMPWSGITTGTNTGTSFVNSQVATGTVLWTYNCPLSMTVDCIDWEINNSKILWIDDNGHTNVQTLNLPGSTTYSILTGNSTGPVGQTLSPAGPGLFTVGYNPTSSTPVALTTFQVGVGSGGGPITGSTSTYTVLYTDVATIVNHDVGGSAGVTVTLPTATTLGDATFGFRYCNQSAHADTITPTTWTIQVNGTAAAATAPVAVGTCILIWVDPNSATNWLASGGTAGTLTLDAVGSPAASKTFADGNFPLAFDAATTSNSQTAIAFGETTAATGTSDVEVGISTASGSTAIPFQITQGAGVSGAAAPSLVSITGGAGGAAATGTSGGNIGGGLSVTAGAGSAGGATSGNGGVGGAFTFTAGNGGTATAGSTAGAGGSFNFITGSPGATGTASYPGNFIIKAGATGAGSSYFETETSGSSVDFNILLSTGTISAYATAGTAGQGAHVTRTNDTTPVTVTANVTTAQNLQSFSVTTYQMNTVGYGMHIVGYGFYSLASNTPTLTFSVNLGSLTLCTWTTGSTTTSAVNAPFQFTCDVVTTTAGAAAVFEAHGTLSIDLGATNLVGETVYGDTNTGTVGTLDISFTQTLQVTVTSSLASTSNSFTERALYVSQF